jgi:hypothetical protein
MPLERPGFLENASRPEASKRGSKFWLLFFAHLVVDLLSALDLVNLPVARFNHLMTHSSDCRFDGVAYHCRPPPRLRLHLGWEYIYHRLSSYAVYHWRSGLDFGTKASDLLRFLHSDELLSLQAVSFQFRLPVSHSLQKGPKHTVTVRSRPPSRTRGWKLFQTVKLVCRCAAL